jgi:hypothetical protein
MAEVITRIRRLSQIITHVRGTTEGPKSGDSVGLRLQRLVRTVSQPLMVSGRFGLRVTESDGVTALPWSLGLSLWRST